MKFKTFEMRKVIFFLFFIFALFGRTEYVSGQDLDEYAEKAIKYSELNDFENAIKFGELFVDATLKEYGNRDTLYIYALDFLKTIYFKAEKYDEAELIGLEKEKVVIDIYGRKSSEYLESLFSIGEMYIQIEAFSKASKLFYKAHDKIKKLFGENSKEYAFTLYKFGCFYFRLEDYKKASYFFQESEQIYLSKKLLDDENYINLYLWVATIGNRTKDFVLTEFASEKLMYLTEKKYGSQSIELAHVYGFLAVFYEDIKKDESAYLLYMKCLKIYQSFENSEQLKANKEFFAEDLLNALSFFSSRKKYIEGVEDIFILAKKVIHYKDKGYPHLLLNFSQFLLYQNDFLNAEITLVDCIQIVENKDRKIWAVALVELSKCYIKKEDYNTADSLIQQGRNIAVKTALDEDKILLPRTGLQTSLFLKETTKKYEEVLCIADTIQRLIVLDFYINLSNMMTEDEANNFIDNNEIFDFLRSKCLGYKDITNNAALIFYNLELSLKNMITDYESKTRRKIYQGKDSLVLSNFQMLTNAKNILSQNYNLSKEKIDSLEEDVYQLEREAKRLSNRYKHELIPLFTEYEDVQKTLKADEAAIEFSAFPYFNGTSWTDSTMYVALVLRKDTKLPVLVPLFEEKSLDSLLQRQSENDSEHISSLYQTDSPQSQKLYQLLWQPLEKSLLGVKKIYFSPSGKLHQVAFSALAQSKNTLLSDKYKLVQVNSTASLAEEKDTLTAPKSAVLFGGIDYNASEAQRSTIVKGFAASDATIAENRALPADLARGSNWNYLPGTKAEVEAIESIAKAKNITTTVFSRQAALEESFKRLAGKQSPDIIHVATHGFFFPDPKKDLNKRDFGFIDKERQPVFRRSDNPLYRGGLLFAGANQAWNGKESSENLEDGILTAYEVSNMYLPNTQLVVLSACETALGEIKGSEGVFGLQRAFQLSGARYLLMSLWKIPDAASAEFMKVFYQHYLGGKTVAEAFRFTQLFMRTKYKNEPYKWAAFVLIEG